MSIPDYLHPTKRATCKAGHRRVLAILIAGCRDWPQWSGRRRPAVAIGRDEHRRPRGIEGAQPGRSSCVRMSRPVEKWTRCAGRKVDHPEPCGEPARRELTRGLGLIGKRPSSRRPSP